MAASKHKTKTPPLLDQIAARLYPYRRELLGGILLLLAALTLLSVLELSGGSLSIWWANLCWQLFGWGAIPAAGLLGLMTWRLVQNAQRAPTKFGQLILVGIGAWIGVQTVVNLMMANGTMPAIGIPLPFISSGGSSLLALWIAL